MSRSINLYTITRITDEKAFTKILFHEMQIDEDDKEKIKCRGREIQSLRILTDALIEKGVKIENLDGFYYGFVIPQIGKEFDLLKINDKVVLNIEIKSEPVDTNKIESQLKKNLHYLSHLSRDILTYCFESQTKTLYKLMPEGLAVVSFDDLVQSVVTMDNYLEENIESLFRPSMFLVSPLNTPEKYVNGEYFLTQRQDEIKDEMLKDIKNDKYTFYYLTGDPGTGKTLLLYDIAKELAKHGKTHVFHCGFLAEKQTWINGKIEGLGVSSIKHFDVILNKNKYIERIYNEKSNSYEINSKTELKNILVDEAHRLHIDQFKCICDYVEKYRIICIFSGDYKQSLSKVEINRNISGKISDLQNEKDYVLNAKVRTNKELAQFIHYVMNNNKKPSTSIQFKNIEISYANDYNEAELFIRYFKLKGYVFINYTPSNYNDSIITKYAGDYNTHHVIGQEFDKVLMILDKNFVYNQDGFLTAYEHPNPNYLFRQLFYQGVTRVREKLALIIINNKELFDKIVEIL